MKLIALAVIILFGVLCVINEVISKSDKRHIAILIAVYALMAAVVLI